MNYTVTQEQNVTFIYMRQFLLHFFPMVTISSTSNKMTIIVMTIHFGTALLRPTNFLFLHAHLLT